MTERILDTDDPVSVARFINAVRRLRGKWRVGFTGYRRRRSDRQNAFYWPCFVHEFGKYMRDQGESFTDNDAHEFFKMKFLTREIIDETSGEVISFTRSTTDLDTSEFNEYLDKCAAWLWHSLNITVPDPADYHVRETQAA